MEGEAKGKPKQVVVAMKGHPGSGKSTLARAIAAHLQCPLLDKDELYSAAFSVFHRLLSSSDPSTADRLVNDLSYDSLWNLAAAQIRLGLSVVVDSPCSRRSSLDRLLQIAAADKCGATVLLIECRPGDEAQWRRRLERRGAAGDARWNQASTWQDLQRMLERYDGCYEYDAGDVPKLVVDTTAPADAEEVLSSVMAFIRSHSTALGDL